MPSHPDGQWLAANAARWNGPHQRSVDVHILRARSFWRALISWSSISRPSRLGRQDCSACPRSVRNVRSRARRRLSYRRFSALSRRGGYPLKGETRAPRLLCAMPLGPCEKRDSSRAASRPLVRHSASQATPPRPPAASLLAPHSIVGPHEKNACQRNSAGRTAGRTG